MIAKPLQAVDIVSVELPFIEISHVYPNVNMSMSSASDGVLARSTPAKINMGVRIDFLRFKAKSQQQVSLTRGALRRLQSPRNVALKIAPSKVAVVFLGAAIAEPYAAEADIWLTALFAGER